MLALPSGIRVRAIEYGPPDGSPVVLVHGWACCAYSFRLTMPALGEAGYRAIAIELKGHGLSDKPDGDANYTLDSMWTSVTETLDALEIGAAPLIGHSMGGALSLCTALRAPERVTRLALLAPAWLGHVSLRQLVRALSPGFLTPILPYLVPRWVARLIMGGAYGPNKAFTPRDVDEYWASSQYLGYAKALRHLLHEFRWELLTKKECAALRQPVLVLFGTRDLVILPTHARELVAAMPNGRIEMIDGVGHVVAEEIPATTNSALLAFLADESR
jgi:pyruvate dehydrogenase E2 component (dihydrolipoamide acetyltransferase)